MSFAEGDRVRVNVNPAGADIDRAYHGKVGTILNVNDSGTSPWPFKVKFDDNAGIANDAVCWLKAVELEFEGKVIELRESAVDMAEFHIEEAGFELTDAGATPPKIKLYLAGPMTGIKDYNFPMFDKVTGILRAAGYEVFNPAENDRENGFDATGLEGHEAHEHGFNLRQALKQDLSWICDHADGIALLPGWEESKGVKAELALANALGMEFQLWSDYLFEAVSPEGKAA